MPPRKKQRTSSVAEASTPAASAPNDTTGRTADRATEDAAEKSTELEPELWTDEEEISLFKGMIRWKPVGMHERFRMISIAQHMRHQGHISEHTRPSGIRQKLDGLYNMKMLDERENAIDEADSETANERYCEFTLPKYEFHDLMMEKRIDEDRDSSPGWLDESDEEEVGSTIEDSDQPMSSPASSVKATRGGRRGRGPRGSRGGRTRGAADTNTRGRTRAESEHEEEVEDEEDDEEADEDDEDDEDGDDDEEEVEDDTPATRTGRGRGRSRASRGGRGRARGRKRG